MSTIIKYLKALKNNISKYRFCYYKTFYANFKLFPFKQAIHLPLVIYGPTQLKLSRSKIKLNVKPRFGLIKWGYNQDLMLPSKMPSMLCMINGVLIINGDTTISSGVVFRILGTVILGRHNFIGGGVKILCCKHIEVGNYSRIGFGSILCDTNFHYIQHDRQVENRIGDVIIGEYIWVGNNSSIVKGARIPNHAIVSSKSYVNKDLSANGEGVLIAGAPAKIIREGYYRIFSPKLENKIQKYFKDNPSIHVYQMSGNDIDIPDDI